MLIYKNRRSVTQGNWLEYRGIWFKSMVFVSKVVLFRTVPLFMFLAEY